MVDNRVFVCVSVCVCVRVRAYVRACVRACVRVRVPCPSELLGPCMLWKQIFNTLNTSVVDKVA